MEPKEDTSKKQSVETPLQRVMSAGSCGRSWSSGSWSSSRSWRTSDDAIDVKTFLTQDIIVQRAEYMREMEDTLAQTPDILRGARLGTVLWRGAEVMRAGADDGRDGYRKSFSVKTMMYFLSHSWHAGKWVKALAMLAYFNTVPAVLFGFLAAAVVFVLDTMGCLPVWAVERRNRFFGILTPGAPTSSATHMWCTMSYLIGYCLVVMNWQSMLGRVWPARRGKGVFLDKMCIHQTDPVLKQHGIRNIGSFLIHSDEMVILLDDTYFTRVWCVFEVAVFFALKDDAVVGLVPISLYCTSLVLHVVVLIAVLVVIPFLFVSGLVDLAIGFLDPLMPRLAILPLITLVGTNAPWLVMVIVFRRAHRAAAKNIEQIMTFQVATARCHDPNDRVLVIQIVRGLFGSEDNFERYVTTRIHTRLGSQGLPYWLAVTLVTPIFVLEAFDGTLMCRDASLAWRVHHVVGIFMHYVLLQPAVVKLLEQMCIWRLVTVSRREEILVVAVLWNLMSAIIALYHGTVPLTTQASIEAKVVTAVVGGTLLCLAYNTSLRRRLSKSVLGWSSRLTSLLSLVETSGDGAGAEAPKAAAAAPCDSKPQVLGHCVSDDAEGAEASTTAAVAPGHCVSEDAEGAEASKTAAVVYI